MAYYRDDAVAYAHKWAYARNPRYLNFEGIGGDCTNFISQCLHAGGCSMNWQPTFGWYYLSAKDRAPAWTGVQYLYNFLVGNKATGPFAEETGIETVLPGDVIQLSFQQGVYAHSLIVVEAGQTPSAENILVATHSIDSDRRPLSSYAVLSARFLKIGAR